MDRTVPRLIGADSGYSQTCRTHLSGEFQTFAWRNFLIVLHRLAKFPLREGVKFIRQHYLLYLASIRENTSSPEISLTFPDSISRSRRSASSSHKVFSCSWVTSPRLSTRLWSSLARASGFNCSAAHSMDSTFRAASMS